ncbi:hypothetical protein [Kitasatospora sp. NPDC001095]
MITYGRWDVLPDGEREQWMLEPFESVGPLRFGMLIDEVSDILSRRTDDLQRYSGPCLAEDPYGLVTGRYRSFGFTLYYWDERLRGANVEGVRHLSWCRTPSDCGAPGPGCTDSSY